MNNHRATSGQVILTSLIKKDTNTINYVFFSDSDYRKRLDEAIITFWEEYEANTSIVVIISYYHFLYKSDGLILRNMLNTAIKNSIPFYELLQDDFKFFLCKRYSFRNERTKYYNVLVDDEQNNASIPKLQKKEQMIKYIYSDTLQIDNYIKKTIDDFKIDYKISVDANLFKDQLKKVLCVHPEKFLEKYDFSDSLNNWRDNSVKRIINQIRDLLLINRLIKHDKGVTNAIFYSKGIFRKKIDQAVADSWKIGEEDFTSIIMMFVYILQKNGGQELKKLKKKIYRDVTFIPIPLFDTHYQPKQLKEFDIESDNSLEDLLSESIYSYLRKHSKFKKERIEHKTLLMAPDDTPRLLFLWGDGSYFNERIISTLKDIKSLIYHTMNVETVKESLYQYLCEDSKAFLLKYDFSMSLQSWRDKYANTFIKNYPIVTDMLNADGKGLDKYFTIRFDKFDNKTQEYKIDDREIMLADDLIQDLTEILLAKDKKVLNDYNYEGDIDKYIMSVANHILLKQKSKMRDEPIRNLKKETKEAIANEFYIETKEKAEVYRKLIEVLKESRTKKKYGLGRFKESSFNHMIDILYEVYVNLKEFTRREQMKKRKMLIKRFNELGLKGESYLRQKEKRAKALLNKVKNEISSTLLRS